MNQSKQTKSQRIDVFDGLKGISLISVIAYYFFQHILPGGYLAVNFFLLIAGFFNFRHFYVKDLSGQKINTLDYYKRRLSRLFFPLLAIILFVGSFILLFARNFMFNLRNMALTSLLFVNNFYQIFNGQSYFVQAANPSPFNHLWYVSLLAQLIILTPIIMKLFYSWHRKPTITINMLLILTVLSAILMGYLYQEGQDPSGLYFSLFTRAFAYTLGGVVGLLFPKNLRAKPIHGRSVWILNIIGLVAFISLFFMLKFMYGTQPFAYRFGMALFTIISAILLMVSIHPSSLWNKLFSLPPLAFIGKRSYSYYIWFYPVYLITPQFLQGLGMNYWMNYIVMFLIIMILSEITYQIFEQRRISLPIGQDFNICKMRYQFNYLKRHPSQLTGIKIITGIYLFVLLTGSIGILAASEQRGNTEGDLEDIIAQNTELAEGTLNQSTENAKVVNYIEGLNQQELLYANGRDITFIGDSVLLSSAEDIQYVFPKAVINGEVGRQMYNSATIPEAMEAEGLLKPIVVTIIGSNGSFTPGQINDYIDAIGPERDIFFVNSVAERSWIPEVNHQILQAAQRYGNVHVIDWASYSNDHPEWHHDDYGHTTSAGSRALAVFIAQEIYRQR